MPTDIEDPRFHERVAKRVFPGTGGMECCVETVHVGVGEVLVFVGHLMHAGAAWGEWESAPNQRIHVYFLPSTLRFPKTTLTIPVPNRICSFMRET
eukprot:3356416-Rhodomonas_salina.1